MAKPWAKSFYNSKQWKECRKGYIASVSGLCERCDDPGYILHHKTYLTPKNINDPSITLSWSNLEYLCKDCHNKEHFEKYSPLRKDVMFDEEGNLVRRDKE
ncbi:HNH endonuclease [Heyndrickxia sp. FSL K6-6286]|uniref:HNH endonuclease n=1 Tax=Heyndrickxia sp. FSL K6-6286 TaxID=2921510 RepID=UPI00315A4353